MSGPRNLSRFRVSPAGTSRKATTEDVSASVNHARPSRPPDPRPTHFLSIPLGHHTSLRNRLQDFNNALLSSSDNIEGLDKTVIIAPRRVHLTLGVMNLVPDGSKNDNGERKTVSAALRLLQSLATNIPLSEGQSPPLNVSLTTLNVLKSSFRSQDGKTMANVLYSSPDEDTTAYRDLLELGEYVRQRFFDEGFITETRTLTLHLSMINTSHRKPSTITKRVNPQAPEDGKQGQEKAKSSKKRFTKSIPFSYTDILNVKDAMNVLRIHGSAEISTDSRKLSKQSIDLGIYPATCVQLCVMGSYGKEGEYVSLGDIPLL